MNSSTEQHSKEKKKQKQKKNGTQRYVNLNKIIPTATTPPISSLPVMPSQYTYFNISPSHSVYLATGNRHTLMNKQ